MLKRNKGSPLRAKDQDLMIKMIIRMNLCHFNNQIDLTTVRITREDPTKAILWLKKKRLFACF